MSTEALKTILNDWLKNIHDTERHGHPTWKALVKAVKSPYGGDNSELT